MNIRPATADDATEIAVFWNPMIRDSAVTFNPVPKSAATIATMIAERQAAGQAFVVAVNGDSILGFACYSQFRVGQGYVHTMEHTVILAPAGQGRGVGRALVSAIEDHARKAGVHSMFAGVSGENPAGIAFHTALGYQQVAVLHEVGRKFGRWMDLHLMQKCL